MNINKRIEAFEKLGLLLERIINDNDAKENDVRDFKNLSSQLRRF